MKSIFIVITAILLFVGCTHVEPKVPVTEVKDKNTTEAFKEQNVSSIVELVEEENRESDNVEEGNLILNVFEDELYFEKDKVGKDKTKVVIKYLDAHKWEKEALRKIYKRYKKLWSKEQSKAFFKILEEDKYFSLCADRRYWDNLQFEESEPERDVLHSILLLRYLNNLSNGCPQWIASKGKIKDENRKEYINSKEILSLLPHDVLVDKLIMLYVPNSKKFESMIKGHHQTLSLDKKEENIIAERLEIETYKQTQKYPKYNKRRE
ncbi:MAG TPA: hypothetical protein ENK94_04205 [Campylobacterales bacterium]|nr:hypothetical protein [Campylobacterales bacterium]